MEIKKNLIIIFIVILLSSLVYSDVSFSDYQYIYENLSKEVNVYEEKLIEVKEESIFNLTTVKEDCTLAYNYTISEKIGTKLEYYQGKRIGVKAGDKDYMGYVNVNDKEGYLYQCFVPVGDRNRKNIL